MAATSGSTTGTKIDLGTVVKAAEGSWGVLKRLSQEITDEKRMQYLTFHWKPSESDILHSHQVTKGKKTWKVSFQSKWLKQFPWLCYSNLLEGGICSHCILFPHKVTKGTTPGVLVTAPYQKSYTKALGKDGILNCHEQSVMHKYATEQADLFKQTFENPDRCRVDSQLATSVANQATENKEILRQIVLAVEFLAKQSLAFRGHRDDRVDFSSYEINRGNFVALLQLLAKGNDSLQKHLLSSNRQARYTSKTIQNDVIHVYASKIKERLTKDLRTKDLPFTIIADECTDPHSNQDPTHSRDRARGRGRHSPSTPLVFKVTSVVYNPPFQKFLDLPLIYQQDIQEDTNFFTLSFCKKEVKSHLQQLKVLQTSVRSEKELISARIGQSGCKIL